MSQLKNCSNEAQLRLYIHCVLIEGAFTVKDAKQNDLALMIYKFGTVTHVILYSPLKFLSFFEKRIKQTLKNYDNATHYDFIDHDEMQKFIYAYTALSPSRHGKAYGAKEVINSVAKSGWGPLIYDIAMSMNDHGLMPDRNSVSPAAANVWAFYDKNRSDVEKLQLDDITEPKTKPKIDDAEVHDDSKRPYLDKVYVKKSSVNTSSLKRANDEFIEDAEKLFKAGNVKSYSSKKLMQDVYKAANVFFVNNYYM